jgi:hypothetical protein
MGVRESRAVPHHAVVILSKQVRLRGKGRGKTDLLAFDDMRTG